MSAPTYIVESRNGNPAILARQANGTYASIANGNGSDSLEDVMALVESANSWEAS